MNYSCFKHPETFMRLIECELSDVERLKEAIHMHTIQRTPDIYFQIPRKPTQMQTEAARRAVWC